MYAGNQTTLLNEVSFFGKPKNMEKVVNVKLLPAEADSGIVFKRIDLKENNLVKVSYENSYIDNDRLVLKNAYGVYIYYAEVLIASIWASKVDNVIIEIDGDSIPFIDGASESFLFLLTIARSKDLEKTRKVIELEQDIGIRVGEFEISVKPSKSFIIGVNEQNKLFKFDNGELPYKDWLAKISEDSEDKLKYHVICAIAIIFISGFFATFEVEFKNFDKKIVYDFFKNFFVNRVK